MSSHPSNAEPPVDAGVASSEGRRCSLASADNLDWHVKVGHEWPQAVLSRLPATFANQIALTGAMRTWKFLRQGPGALLLCHPAPSHAPAGHPTNQRWGELLPPEKCRLWRAGFFRLWGTGKVPTFERADMLTFPQTSRSHRPLLKMLSI
jgi:hypothetical protein